MKLHPPITLILHNGVSTATGYPSERPEPTEYLSAEMNKSDLNKWLASKIELPVSEGSKEEINRFLITKLSMTYAPPKLSEALKSGYDISELAGRIAVVEQRFNNNCNDCKGRGCDACYGEGYVLDESKTKQFIALLPEKVLESQEDIFELLNELRVDINQCLVNGENDYEIKEAMKTLDTIRKFTITKNK